LIDYQDDSAKHATSPSHRDCARQAAIPRYVSISAAMPEFKIVQSLRRAPQLVFLTRPLASPSVRFSIGWCVSLSLEASETPMSRLRNFDTKPPSSYCYEFRSDNRLESVANVHTAADLHARPVP
jgi:hypothetical protein